MGFRSSWIAVRGASLPTVMAELDLQYSDSTWECDTPISGVNSKGWSAAVGSMWESIGLFSRQKARQLSCGTEVLFFWQSDGVMCAELICYFDGEEKWGIRYFDGVPNENRLLASGDLPTGYDEIVRWARQRQADADKKHPGLVSVLYEVPARVGELLVGFRSDNPDTVEEYEPAVLKRGRGSAAILDPVLQHLVTGVKPGFAPDSGSLEVVEEAACFTAREVVGPNADVEAHIDDSAGTVSVFHFRRVTTNAPESEDEISEADAQTIDPGVVAGNDLGVTVNIDQRVLAFHISHAFKAGLASTGD